MLTFKARGVLRRLLQEFNEFVIWDLNSDVPHLQISDEDMERVQFYAELEEILRQYFESGERHRLFPVPIDEDRWRLGGYYVMDWVLRSEGRPFSASELLREDETSDFDPLLHISRRNIEALLEHFAEYRILDIIREMNAGATLIGDVAESGAKVYRLTEDVQRKLFGFALKHESERAAKSVPLTGTFHTDASARGPIELIGGHYILGDLIGQGGMAAVYRAEDSTSGQPVAIKMLRTSLNDDSKGVARFQREAEITKRLRHPQIVRTIDLIEEGEAVALVMELIEGPTLANLIAEHGPMRPSRVAEIGHLLASALQYLAEQKVSRIDLKPSNIIMHRDRGPIIIDLGIARSEDLDALTGEGLVIGTPGFMSPEQVRGDHIDPRADLFVLGIVLYYCLAGESPYGQGDAMAILYRVLNTQIDVTDLSISAEFRQVITRATALQPDERFPNAAEFQKALEGTPEWRPDNRVQHEPTTIIARPQQIGT